VADNEGVIVQTSIERLGDSLPVDDADAVAEAVPLGLRLQSERLIVLLIVLVGVTVGVRVWVRERVCECEAVILRVWLRVTDLETDCDLVALVERVPVKEAVIEADWLALMLEVWDGDRVSDEVALVLGVPD